MVCIDLIWVGYLAISCAQIQPSTIFADLFSLKMKVLFWQPCS